MVSKLGLAILHMLKVRLWYRRSLAWMVDGSGGGEGVVCEVT